MRDTTASDESTSPMQAFDGIICRHAQQTLARDIGSRALRDVQADERLHHVLRDDGRGPYVPTPKVTNSLRRLVVAGRVRKFNAPGTRDVLYEATP